MSTTVTQKNIHKKYTHVLRPYSSYIKI